LDNTSDCCLPQGGGRYQIIFPVLVAIPDFLASNPK
jgi:hypothetical protein